MQLPNLLSHSSLFTRLRADSQALWPAFTTHRFLQALADGSLPAAEFRAWLIQDYFYLIDYARALALRAYKCENLADLQHASNALSGLLSTELPLHLADMRTWGIDDSTLANIPSSTATLAYAGFILDRAQIGDALDIVVTMSVCLVGYAEIGLALQDKAKNTNTPYLHWIDTYCSPAYLALVAQDLQHLETLWHTLGSETRYPRLLKHFQQAVRLETEFWNAGQTAFTTNISQSCET